jgi:hypothetical protein
MNTSLISRFFAAVAACLGLAQAAVAHDSIAAETDSVWIFSDRYISAEHEFSQAAVAHDSIAAETDSVWIFSDRYISAEQEFSNPEPLDARVRPTRPRVISLDVCEPFAARLLSLAYQFRDFHLEIRPLAAEHSACMDQAVDRYWLSVMP